MIIVSEDFQDYDDDDPDLKWRQQRFEFWKALKKCRQDYHTEYSPPQDKHDGFIIFLEEKYGLTLQMLEGNITDKYSIVDEQKFIIFKLRYM